MKETRRATSSKAILIIAIILSFASGCTGPLAMRSPFGELASPTLTPFTETISRTLTHTSTPEATATREPTPTVPEATATTEPSPTPEPILGGDEIGVSYFYFDGVSVSQIPPPEIVSLLFPTSPERWQELMNLTDSTGKPLAWGKPAFFLDVRGFLDAGDGIFPVIPFLIRDVVQHETFKGDNTPMYQAILETPAYGGSNFVLLQLTPHTYGGNPEYDYFEYPATGIPREWINQQVSAKTVDAFSDNISTLNDKQLRTLFLEHVGSVILIDLPDIPRPVGTNPEYEKLVTCLSEAELLPKGFMSTRASFKFFLPH